MTAAGGTNARVSELFALYSDAVYRYAARRIGPHDAEDVVAEVFATACRQPQRIPSVPLPWLYRCAANHILHAQRSSGRRERLNAKAQNVQAIAGADHGDSVAGRIDAENQVAAALGTLSDSDVEVLRLWAWEQLTTDEIACVLGCRPGTARVRLHRARERVTAALKISVSNASELAQLELVSS